MSNRSRAKRSQAFRVVVSSLHIFRSSTSSIAEMNHKSNAATHPAAQRATDGAADRSEAIYLEIRRALMEQRLSPGTRLPEAHLAEIFGVSRTLVRQALQRLAHDQLVVVELNRGARVAEPSIEDVRHLYAVRRLIECAVLAEGGFALSRARIAALRKVVANEAKANARGDILLSMQLSGQFHLDLLTALNNPIVTDILRELIARGNVAIALYELRGRASCRCEEHREIVQRLAAGNVAGATDVMRRHLSDIEESLIVARKPRTPANLRALLIDPETTRQR